MTFPKTLSFHIGAHKTATTHFQRSVGGRRKALLAAGVSYLGPGDLRGDRPGLAQRLGIEAASWAPKSDEALADALAELTQGAPHLAISEENYVGNLLTKRGPLRLPLYQRGPGRIAELARKIAPDGLTLLLGIRRPDTFMSSAYTQHLRAGGRTPVAELAAHLDFTRIDWPDLVARFADTPGVSRLVVWRYEDYADVFDQIAAAFLGPSAELVRPFPERVHEGLSWEAVARILAEPDRTDIVRLSREAAPVGPQHPAYSHYDDDLAPEADAFYAGQVAQIAAMPQVTLLRPGATQA